MDIQKHLSKCYSPSLSPNEFEPFQSYFSFTDELPTHAEDRSNMSETKFKVYEKGSPFHHLEIIRRDAYDEFQMNGIDREVDDFDICQVEMRGKIHSKLFSLITSGAAVGSGFPNKLIAEYLQLSSNKPIVTKKKDFCVFCKNNGEPKAVYSSHLLKDAGGRVTCPILRRYVCPICGKTGDNSHTIKYCPLNTGLTLGAYQHQIQNRVSKRQKI